MQRRIVYATSFSLIQPFLITGSDVGHSIQRYSDDESGAILYDQNLTIRHLPMCRA